MGIEAVWRTESGEELGRVSDPHMILSKFATAECDRSRTLCLRFLDPYGDACFNQRQIPLLAEELESAAATLMIRSLGNTFSRLLNSRALPAP
jgi:hypothetical protein